jgi:myo-inositol-1(or 4)-monophosphatase
VSATLDVSTGELVRLARSLAVTGRSAIAAELTRAAATPGGLEIHTKSSPADFVTAADLASEKAILAHLDRTRPDDEVLAEESGSRPGTTPWRWLIDPVDGTMNFVHGRRDHAVSVGVEPIEDGPTPAGQHAIAGAIALPATGEVFWGAGTEAFVDDGSETDAGTHHPGVAPRWIHVSGCDRLADAIIGVGYPRGEGARAAAHTWFGVLLDEIRDYRRLGSSACDLVNVANGTQDGYVAFGVLPWDVAGGFALVRAAGGQASWIRAASGRDVAVAGTDEVFAALAERVAVGEV